MESNDDKPTPKWFNAAVNLVVVLLAVLIMPWLIAPIMWYFKWVLGL